MRPVAVVAAVVVALAAAGAAEAKTAKPKAGVAVDALVPSMKRLKVAAPAKAGLPVRLVYGAQQAEVLVDVVVAPSEGEARAALERWKRTVAREPEASGEVGDVAWVGPNMIGFTRGNVMVAMRRVGGGADVLALAKGAEAAIDAAAAGATAAAAPVVRLPALAVGASAKLAVPGTWLAVEVEATGPAQVRRDGAAWRLTRTGEGTIGVVVRAVDARLRVTP
jgi:hypothetical protein